MAKPTLSSNNGFVEDCDDASDYVEHVVNMAGADAELTVQNGDVFRIEGNPDDAGDEYVYYEYPDSGGADDIDISTNTYTQYAIKWKTSVASNGMKAQVRFLFSDASTQIVDLGYATNWTYTTGTMTASKTLDHIKLYANDDPDSVNSGTYYVYYDWILVYGQTFTFPHVAPGGVSMSFPMKLAELDIPGKNGNVLQRLGMKSPIIRLKGDVLPGETWETSSTKVHFDYIIKSLVTDEWAVLTSDYPRLKCQVMYDDFRIGMETRNNKAVMVWELDLKLRKLGDLSDFDYWRWMYTA